MKITFLVPGYIWSPSGGIRVIYEYANQLVSRGHEVAVVHPLRSPHVPSAENVNVRQWARDKLEHLAGLALTPSVKWQSIDKRVRLLYVRNPDSDNIPDADIIFATGWTTVGPVLEYPRSKGEKCYLIQGYESYHARKELVDATWRAPLRKVVIAKWMLDLGRELGCDDLSYIPNAIDHKRYRLTQPIKGRSKQVAMLFSSTQIKGASDGIEALRIVRERNPDLKVVFFGLSRRLKWIPEWVTYYRNPAQDFLINEIYNKSSIFLAPSWSEGSPLPPAEAASCGCAIVATDIGGFKEYIQDGVTGLLSPAREPKTLAENLRMLLADEQLRVRLAQACNSFLSRASWERSTDLLEDFMCNVARQTADAVLN